MLNCLLPTEKIIVKTYHGNVHIAALKSEKTVTAIYKIDFL